MVALVSLDTKTGVLKRYAARDLRPTHVAQLHPWPCYNLAPQINAFRCVPQFCRYINTVAPL